MIVNNFKQIASLLSFTTKDSFYHLQILKRKKDCAEFDRGRNNNARCIKTYYIKSIEDFQKHEQEIIQLCEIFTARAYINLNEKSMERAAYELNCQLADRLRFKQFDYTYRLFDTIIGGGYLEDEEDGKGPATELELGSKINIGQKRWIIDVDEPEISPIMCAFIDYHCLPQVVTTENGSAVNYIKSKIIASIPTKSGWHLITTPFNLQQFHAEYPDIDIQKNNPTVCYFNHKEE